MPVDFDAIRKEIAVKHNVLLTKDDPVLVTVSLNEIVLAHYLELLSETYDDQARILIQSSQAHTEQSLEQATKTAEKIINQSTEYVSQEIKDVVNKSVTEAYSLALKQAAQLNDDLKRQLNDQAATVSEVRTSRNTSIIAAVIAICCALLILVVALVK